MSNVQGSRPQNAHLVGGYQPPPTSSSSSSSSVTTQGPTQTPREELVREGKSKEGDSKSLESLNPQVAQAGGLEVSSSAAPDIATTMRGNFEAMVQCVKGDSTARLSPAVAATMTSLAAVMMRDLKKAGHTPEDILSACLGALKECRAVVERVPGDKSGKTEPMRFHCLRDIVLTEFNRMHPGQFDTEQLARLLTAFPTDGLEAWLSMVGGSLANDSIMRSTLQGLADKTGKSPQHMEWLTNAFTQVIESSVPADLKQFLVSSSLEDLGTLGIPSALAELPASLTMGRWSFLTCLAAITEQSTPEVAGRLWQCAGRALGGVLQCAQSRGVNVGSEGFFRALVNRHALFVGAGSPGPVRERVIESVRGWREGVAASYAKYERRLPDDFRGQMHAVSLLVTQALVPKAGEELSSRETERADQVAALDIARLFKSQILAPMPGAAGDSKSKS